MRFLLLAATLVQLLFAAEVTPEKIAGRWRSLETSKGGIGAIFIFRPGGILDFSPGTVVESDYRIEGAQLILPSATVNGPELKQTIEWSGDDKFKLSHEGPGMELTRVGKRGEGQDAIIGEWTASREVNGNRLEQRWLFYPTGKCLLLIPFTTEHGKYSLDKQSIRIELSNGSVVEGKVDLDGDVLTIPGPRGTGTSRFRRYWVVQSGGTSSGSSAAIGYHSLLYAKALDPRSRPQK